MSKFDFDFASLGLATIGLFFICCAIVQKKPKHILEEAFGLYRGGLRDLKSSVFKRNQVVMGFCCVVLAIVLNIFSPATGPEGGLLGDLSPFAKVAALVFFMVVLCGVLNYLSRLWSKASFKRLVYEVATEYRWPFEENMVLTREIGRLLGIVESDEDTVQSYVARIRRHLNLPREIPRDSAQRRISQFG
ncbi:MAG: hypothetical protein R3F20_17070 [Planctomycetota bacterium]